MLPFQLGTHVKHMGRLDMVKGFNCEVVRALSLHFFFVAQYL